MDNEQARILKGLKATLRQIATCKELQMESVWIYDNLYLPLNNHLAKHGHAKYDDGQLS